MLVITTNKQKTILLYHNHIHFQLKSIQCIQITYYLPQVSHCYSVLTVSDILTRHDKGNYLRNVDTK